MEEIFKMEGNEFIEKIKKEAENLVNKKVSMHQLRNIFSQVKNIKDPKKLYVLRYRLAYIGSKNPDIQDFLERIDKVIKSIEKEEQLLKFKEFFEALVAYHKYFETIKKQR